MKRSEISFFTVYSRTDKPYRDILLFLMAYPAMSWEYMYNKTFDLENIVLEKIKAVKE